MNSNLVSLTKLNSVIINKNLLHLIREYGYANDGKHKYYVILKNTNRKIKFGDVHYEDYLIHNDKERRDAYRTRHANDKINDPSKSGFWSYHVLW